MGQNMANNGKKTCQRLFIYSVWSVDAFRHVEVIGLYRESENGAYFCSLYNLYLFAIYSCFHNCSQINKIPECSGFGTKLYPMLPNSGITATEQGGERKKIDYKVRLLEITS